MNSYWLEVKINLAGFAIAVIGLIIAFKINERIGVIIVFFGILIGFHGLIEAQKKMKALIVEKYNKEHKKDKK
ncbi:hypothetical protein GCM10011403_20860 [Pseudohongiella nitratireducens]|jgi:hypothetical protein|uniref:Uncharacterized protein n=1 Tax=Pseudohongiella nitratireducens TaxID=1768907 RepID=A0A916QK89_9GAMM|nr:hypothetical protein [Pseudohongiella nitratireducens]GFZ77562.1 hypothetical protein GCM10011403_20860 [Pseudohongiella nitratireducens]